MSLTAKQAAAPAFTSLRTNSLAATLPAELLAHIRDLAFEVLPSSNRQTECFAYSQVCRSWHRTFHTNEEYYISGVGPAGLLADQLEQKGTGGRIKTLELVYDTTERDLARLARLVCHCSETTQLCIIVREDGHATTGGAFLSGDWDVELRDALGGIAKVEAVTITACRSGGHWEKDAMWNRSSFNRLLSAWNQLRVFRTDNITVLNDTMSNIDKAPTLVHSLWWNQAGSAEAAIDVMYSSQTSLKHVDVNPTLPVDLVSMDRLKSIWDNGAPNLVNVALMDIWTDPASGAAPSPPRAFVASLAMVSLKSVLLDLDEFDVLAGFNCFAKLPKLDTITVYDFFPEPCPRALQPMLLSSFLECLKSAPSLKEVNLCAPQRLSNWFSDDGDEEARKIAREKGVELTLVFDDGKIVVSM